MKKKLCTCGCGDVIQYPKIGKQWIDRKHYIHWLNTSEAGQKQVVKAARKAIEQKKKEQRKADNEVREKLKTLSQLENEAKAAVQKWVRLVRDKDLPCISCGKFSNRYDGGHYFDAGIYSGLMFHEDNINKQCKNYCNRMNHGNKVNYRIGLVKKIGLERVEWLENNKDLLRNKKYSRDELIEVKIRYNNLIKLSK